MCLYINVHMNYDRNSDPLRLLIRSICHPHFLKSFDNHQNLSINVWESLFNWIIDGLEWTWEIHLIDAFSFEYLKFLLWHRVLYYISDVLFQQIDFTWCCMSDFLQIPHVLEWTLREIFCSKVKYKFLQIYPLSLV